MTKLEVYSQIADLKEIDYQNTLAIASMIGCSSKRASLISMISQGRRMSWSI